MKIFGVNYSQTSLNGSPGTDMDSGQMYHVYQNEAGSCCCLFIPLFFIFLSKFQTLKIFRHFSQEL